MGFPVTEAMLNPIREGEVEIIYAVPKGEWVDPREPVLTIKGPQALVSYLEPLLIGRISYQMQVATACWNAWQTYPDDPTPMEIFSRSISTVTCEEQKRLTLEACTGAGVVVDAQDITVDEKGYFDAVQAQCQKLRDTGVHPSRFFEVGLRAATCMEQHLIALWACKHMGFNLTSNVYGAKLLGMTPVGTLGHEGIMRWGGDEDLAFRKHMHALPKVTFLLDTNDTLKVGLPKAFELMVEYPDRMDGVRPDSGDLVEQFEAYVQGLKDHGIGPRPWVFEDGLDEKKVAGFERLRKKLDFPKEMTLYGLGGYFVDRPEYTPYKRGTISMIYKLSWTETYGPVMKFGNETEEGDSGKQSLPGIPVTYARTDINQGPPILVGQDGEWPDGYSPYTDGCGELRAETVDSRPDLDSYTTELIQDLIRMREIKTGT